MNVNDGTQTCPTCLSAGSISTIKAVARLRDDIAQLRRALEVAAHTLDRAGNLGDSRDARDVLMRCNP